MLLTRKKVHVDPPWIVPYAIFVCLAKSSADSIGETIRSTVKKAARFAVYEEIMINVKNHHIPPTIRVDTALGLMSDPCCIKVPTANQNALDNVNMFSSTALSGLQGWGLYHSYGLNRAKTYIIKLTTYKHIVDCTCDSYLCFQSLTYNVSLWHV